MKRFLGTVLGLLLIAAALAINLVLTNLAHEDPRFRRSPKLALPPRPSAVVAQSRADEVVLGLVYEGRVVARGWRSGKFELYGGDPRAVRTAFWNALDPSKGPQAKIDFDGHSVIVDQGVKRVALSCREEDLTQEERAFWRIVSSPTP